MMELPFSSPAVPRWFKRHAVRNILFISLLPPTVLVVQYLLSHQHVVDKPAWLGNIASSAKRSLEAAQMHLPNSLPTGQCGFKTLQKFSSDYSSGFITHYESERTGMQVVVVDAKGPKVSGAFVLATEIHDDSGARKLPPYACAWWS